MGLLSAGVGWTGAVAYGFWPLVAVVPCRRQLQTELVGWFVGRLVG